MNRSQGLRALASFLLIIPVSHSASFAQTAFERPVVSQPQWVVPSEGVPSEFNLLRSNNCVGIAQHEGRLYMAWRSAPSHFASKITKIFIMSYAEPEKAWRAEQVIEMGTDMREPFLISFHGQLFFTFFQAGKDPLKFEPKHMMRTVRSADGTWSGLEAWGTPGEVPWELKVRNDKIYMTSYLGNHYSAGKSKVDVHFTESSDGYHWSPVNPAQPIVYEGGVSEVAFEFTEAGKLWAVTRNEDGDDSGWGSHVATADHFGKDAWKFPGRSDPNRYDSPRMFRHGSDIYLVARRDIRGPFDRGLRHLPFAVQKWIYLTSYSLRPKRTALYHINQETSKVEWIQDLPSAGDTSFPSVVQTGPDQFLVANYTSPPEKSRWNWLRGQVSKLGTQIYLVHLDFKPSK